jgi:quercetin dioxygenase-like cupin family protein
VFRTIASALVVLAGVSIATLVAQTRAGGPVWETLIRAPLPEDSEPFMSINGLSVSAEPVAEHSHASPVFAYVVQGEIENHVEPGPPAVHKAGGFFYEPPRHLHKMLRGLSPTEPAQLIIMGAGRTGVPASLIKLLDDEPVQLLRFRFGEPTQPLRYQFREPLVSTVNQELRLVRLTLPAGARAHARAHSGRGLVFVLEGEIEVSGATARPRAYGAGDLFREPAGQGGIALRNTSASESARLLLYQVSAKEKL